MSEETDGLSVSRSRKKDMVPKEGSAWKWQKQRGKTEPPVSIREKSNAFLCE
jgi:hypothetical protein